MPKVISDRDSVATGFEWLVFLLFTLGLFAWLVIQGAREGGDSLSYIDAEAFRSPGYVGLVALYRLILPIDPGQGFAEAWRGLAALQILFGLAGAWGFCLMLRGLYRLPYWALFVAYGLLLSPYFFGDYRIGNTLQSEALAYPLWLLGLGLLLGGLARRRLKPLLLFLALLVVLMLIRKQFLFVYPAFAILLVYVLWAFPQGRPAKLLLVAAFAASFLLPLLLERGYIYARTGEFRGLPFTGIQLVVGPLYLSTPADRALYAGDPELLAFFDALEARLSAQTLRREDLDRDRAFADHYYHHYAGAYNEISWGVVAGFFKARGPLDWPEIDRLTLGIAIPWIQAHPLDFLRLHLNALKFYLGGYYLMTVTLLLALLAVATHLRRGDPVSLGLALTVLLQFGNIGTVALVEPIIRRYSIYTEIPLALFLLLLGYCLFRSPDTARGPGRPARDWWGAD